MAPSYPFDIRLLINSLWTTTDPIGPSALYTNSTLIWQTVRQWYIVDVMYKQNMCQMLILSKNTK